MLGQVNFRMTFRPRVASCRKINEHVLHKPGRTVHTPTYPSTWRYYRVVAEYERAKWCCRETSAKKSEEKYRPSHCKFERFEMKCFTLTKKKKS